MIRKMMWKKFAVVGIFIWCSAVVCVAASKKYNYHDALVKSLVFFEGQRSGKLPPDQRIKWRADSGLTDGSTENVDLSGGYYDAGDNVKFGLPMAFTTTMLAWNVLEYGKFMPKEVNRAREAVRWGSDYLLKAASPLPNALYVQVGDPNVHHKCWQRAEDLKEPQPVYKVTPQNPGSDVAAETAAALAAASLVFKDVDPPYSKKLLETAEKAFEFADKYKGKYSDSLKSVVCPFYCSYSGYRDELLWGAGWLYMATDKASYLDYAQSLNIEDDSDCFSWDNKLAGARILLSRDYRAKNPEAFSKFCEKAEKYICSVLPSSPTVTVAYTPGGLMYKMDGSNLQYVTSSSFLLTTYAKFLKASNRTIKCGDMVVDCIPLRKHVRRQVDYILGDNPLGMSYMVGYGDKFPQRIHHRGSSLPSFQEKSETIECQSGFDSLRNTGPNPNILTGAIVGGPDKNDYYSDERDNYEQSEPATYINAPLIGPLAFLADKFDK